MIWLYTECVEPVRDGPFVDVYQAMLSPLWEWPFVCLWYEEKVSGGWAFENVKYREGRWGITSQGNRPAELVRPAFLMEAISYRGVNVKTKQQILAEIMRVHAETCEELGIANAPIVEWEIAVHGESTAKIHWSRMSGPEVLIRPSWAELSFAVLLRFEDELT